MCSSLREKLNLPDNPVLSDVYKCHLEFLMRTAFVPLPESMLTHFHSELKNALLKSEKTYQSIGISKDLGFEGTIEKYHQAAKIQVEGQEYSENNVVFNDKYCHTERGRHYNFYKGDLKEPPNISIIGSDVTASSILHAIEHFGSDFSGISARPSSSSALGRKFKDVVSMTNMTFKNLALDKGVLWGAISKKVTNFGCLEVNERNNKDVFWTYDVNAQIYFHSPIQVKCLDMQLEWETSMTRMVLVFKLGNSRENQKVPVELPILTLHNHTFEAVTTAECKFTVEKGIHAAPGWYFLLGIPALWNERKIMEFDSPQMRVSFRASGKWFKIKEKPDIVISKEMAHDFLEKEKKMVQFQAFLGYENELKMLENQQQESINEMSDEMAADSIISAFDHIKEQINCGLDIANSVNNGPNDIVARWNLNLTAAWKGGQKLNYGEYHVTLRTLGDMVDTLHLEIARSTEAAANLQSGANNGLLKNCLVKGNQYYNIELRNLSGQDVNNLNSFGFEELTSSRVLSKAIKEGVPLRMFDGDGAGTMPNLQGVETKTPEFVDAVFQDMQGRTVGVQYKNTRNEFHPYPDGSVKHNVDSMHEKWHDTWQGNSYVTDNNLPRELELENVKFVVPKGAADDATVGADSSISIGKIKVDAPTNQELEEFLSNNYPKLKDMMRSNKVIGDCKKDIDKLGIKIKELKTKVASDRQKQASASQDKAKQGLQKAIDKKIMELDKLKSDLEKQMETLEKAKKEFQEANEKNAKWQDIDDEIQHGKVAKEVADKHEMDIKKERQDMKQKAKNELKKALILAAVISGGTELVISLTEEITLYKEGRQSLSLTAGNICKRTMVATAKGLLIGGGVGLTQYTLGRMAMSESSKLAQVIGGTGAKVLGPSLLVLGLGYQSYQIIKSFNRGEIDKAGVALQFTRMGVMTGGSIASFQIAAALISSTGVGLAVGAVACIGIGVLDHFIFKEDEKAVATREYRKLKKDVVDTAYRMFDLEEHCSDDELRRAYLSAVRKYHPDKNPDDPDDTDDQVKAVITAYSLLKAVRKKSC